MKPGTKRRKVVPPRKPCLFDHLFVLQLVTSFISLADWANLLAVNRSTCRYVATPEGDTAIQVIMQHGGCQVHRPPHMLSPLYGTLSELLRAMRVNPRNLTVICELREAGIAADVMFLTNGQCRELVVNTRGYPFRGGSGPGGGMIDFHITSTIFTLYPPRYGWITNVVGGVVTYLNVCTGPPPLTRSQMNERPDGWDLLAHNRGPVRVVLNPTIDELGIISAGRYSAPSILYIPDGCSLRRLTVIGHSAGASDSTYRVHVPTTDDAARTLPVKTLDVTGVDPDALVNFFLYLTHVETLLMRGMMIPGKIPETVESVCIDCPIDDVSVDGVPRNTIEITQRWLGVTSLMVVAPIGEAWTVVIPEGRVITVAFPNGNVNVVDVDGNIIIPVGTMEAVVDTSMVI